MKMPLLNTTEHIAAQTGGNQQPEKFRDPIGGEHCVSETQIPPKFP
jgi:hypothetical protein